MMNRLQLKMIQKQQSQTLKISQLQTHKLLKVSSHSHDQSLLSLSVIVSSRLCPSLTLSSISSSVAVISVAAVAVFLLAVLWLICRKTAGEFQIYSFRTIKNSSDLTVMMSKWSHVQIVCIIETCGLYQVIKQKFIPAENSCNVNLRELSSQTTDFYNSF